MGVSLAGLWEVGSKEAEQSEYRLLRGGQTIAAMATCTGAASDDIEIAGQ